MRPVEKGGWPTRPAAAPKPNRPAPVPIKYSFNIWGNAKKHLEKATGKYCHFCERRINNCLAVEHIKARDTHPRLTGSWTNFLLICTSCNSRKSADVLLSPYRQQYYWPHLNNTVMAFECNIVGADALVTKPRAGLTPQQKARAQRTIDLYGLDQPITSTGEADARAKDRAETLAMALDFLTDYQQGKATERGIADFAASRGDFTLFLDLFKTYPEVCRQIINHNFYQGSGRFFDQNLAPLPRNPGNILDPI